MNPPGRRARVGLALVVLATAAAGCNRFGRAPDGEGEVAATTPTAAAMSEPVAVAPETTPTAAARTPASSTTSIAGPASPPTIPASGGDPDGVANRNVRDHDGWRVQLTVGQPAADGSALLEIVLTNTSERLRYYVVESLRVAYLTSGGEVVWRSEDCNPTGSVYEVPGGASPLEPGASVTVVTRYPTALRDSVTPKGCRLPPGDYEAVGVIPVCPDDFVEPTANPGTYRCAEGRATFLDSGPVAVVLG